MLARQACCSTSPHVVSTVSVFRNGSRIPLNTTVLSIILKVLASAIRLKRKEKIQGEKDKTCPYLKAVHVKNPKESTFTKHLSSLLTIRSAYKKSVVFCIPETNRKYRFKKHHSP
jgi:hypothetical protein